MKNLYLITFILFFLSLNSSAQNCCSPLITNGLVGYYPFCGNADDMSNNGNNGTVNGATLTTDRFGNPNSAYEFNGTSSYIDLGTPADMQFAASDTFTISVWIYTTDTLLTRSIISYGDSAYHIYLSKIASSIPYVQWAKALVANTGVTAAQTGVISNNWYHLVLINRVGQDVTFYINDSLVHTAAFNRTYAYNKHLTIGTTQNENYFFKGKIDDCHIYDRALSPSEIHTLYTACENSGCCSPLISNGLIGYYPFCGNAADMSANGNDGTVNGATLTGDRFGNPNSAYEFNGINDYIDLGAPASMQFAPGDTFTVSAWIYATDTLTSHSIISYGDSAYHLYLSRVSSSVPYIQWAKALVAHSGISPAQTRVYGNTWNHIAVINSVGHSLEIYINGALEYTFAFTGTYAYHNNLVIGNTLNENYHFQGKLDDYRIYNRALTLDEIQTLYNECGSSTGFNPIAPENNISIFPNPSKGKFTVSLSDYSDAAVKIYNALGGVTYQTVVNHRADIDLGKAASGLYFMHIYVNDRQLVRKLVVE